jgi:hypothetical protein
MVKLKSNSFEVPFRRFFFQLVDGFYGLLSGVLVLTQHLNGKYSVSSRSSDERLRDGHAATQATGV